MTDNKNVMTGKGADDSRMAGHPDATADAHAKHTLAIMKAQKEKNETNATAHALHKDSGMGSHTVSNDPKTGVPKAGSDGVMADAHNLHKHAGIEAFKVSPDAKTGDYKTDTHAVTDDAHAKHMHEMMNSQKEKNETNATAHRLHKDAETKTHIVTGGNEKSAVNKDKTPGVKATNHTLPKDAGAKPRSVTAGHKKNAVHKAGSTKIAAHVPGSPSKK
jgi:copper chaperone CopZ